LYIVRVPNLSELHVLILVRATRLSVLHNMSFGRAKYFLFVRATRFVTCQGFKLVTCKGNTLVRATHITELLTLSLVRDTQSLLVRFLDLSGQQTCNL